MAAVKVTIQGIIIADGVSKVCTIIGDASLTGLGVGGGPIYPDLHPEHPIVLPPEGGGAPPEIQFPIVIPPGTVPPPKPGYPPYVSGGPIIPDTTPPEIPPIDVPPPGSVTNPPGNPPTPVNPIVIPKFILVYYPGYGWVIVTPPAMPGK